MESISNIFRCSVFISFVMYHNVQMHNQHLQVQLSHLLISQCNYECFLKVTGAAEIVNIQWEPSLSFTDWPNYLHWVPALVHTGQHNCEKPVICSQGNKKVNPVSIYLVLENQFYFQSVWLMLPPPQGECFQSVWLMLPILQESAFHQYGWC